jgi:hypothetical protein
MRKEDKININGKVTTVKEMTVGDVRHWMMDMIAREKSKDEQSSIDLVIDQGFLQEIGLSDIIRMTDITRCQLDHFAPSELMVVVEKCKELNPDFFGLRKKLLGVVPKNALIG